MGTTTQLSEKLRSQYALCRSWPRTAKACKVITPEGRPNPRLAQMIAGGYDPRKPETRRRLGLPPICHVCYRRIPMPRPKPPAWVTAAADMLQELEAKQLEAK